MHNSNFHILTQIVGTRNTPDEAYRVLFFELEEKLNAYAQAEASVLRSEAELDELARLKKSRTRNEAITATADEYEYLANQSRHRGAMDRCEQTIRFITDLMAEIRPMCKYVGRYPDAEAFELCQSEEWALEHVKRAKCFLVTQGTIPFNYFEGMLVHPHAATFILPAISDLMGQLTRGELGLAAFLNDKPAFYSALLAAHPALCDTPRLAGDAKAFRLVPANQVGVPQVQA